MQINHYCHSIGVTVICVQRSKALVEKKNHVTQDVRKNTLKQTKT